MVQTKLDGLFIDHLFGNETTKDVLGVLDITEATVMFVSKVFPEMKFIYILIDNASCNSNNVINEALPFIYDLYEIQLLEFWHGKAQRGKGPADVHFTVVIRYLHRCVMRTTCEV